MRHLLLLLSLLVACTQAPLAPEEPAWGKQPCAHCAMLLSEPPPAAQAVMSDGSRTFFDDVGCLAAYLARPGVRASATWVHAPDGRWIDGQTARYRGGHATPMDYGYMAAEDGVSFSEVQRAVLAKNQAREASR